MNKTRACLVIVGLVALGQLSAHPGHCDDVFEVTATIRVGASPQGIAADAKTNRVYVACAGVSKIFVIDGASNGVIAEIQTPFSPWSVGINAATDRIYVTDSTGSKVAVIDGATSTVISSAPITPISDTVARNTAFGPEVGTCRLGVNSDTNRVYAACSIANAIFVIDGVTHRVLDRLLSASPAFFEPSGIGVDVLDNLVYVTNYKSNRVAVADGRTWTVLYSIPVGRDPVGRKQPAVNPKTHRVYVTSYESDAVYVIARDSRSISPKLRKEVSRVSNYKSWNPLGVAVDADIDLIYVANNGSNSVAVIDGFTDAVLANVAVGKKPVSVAVNSRTHRVYVTNSERGADSVSVIVIRTPEQAIQLMIDRVKSLIGMRLLQQDHADALMATLRAVIEQLDRGRVQSARTEIQAFIIQLDALILDRPSLATQGEALINAAKATSSRIGS